MNILIGGTTLEVTNCIPFQHPNGKRELRITLPQNIIGYDDLVAVLEGETSKIVLTKDDGNTHTFAGYETTYELTSKTENDVRVWYIVMFCVAEAERRASEAKATAIALERIVAMQNETIAAQAAEVELLNDTLLEVLMG